MQKFRVTSDRGRYDVVAGRGAWRMLRRLPRHSSNFILTERGLWARWGKAFRRESGLGRAKVLYIPAGETSKSLAMVEKVSSALLDEGADRHSLLVAFGGGVVGDLGGFVASTYMRGIDCVQVPTTVVAQVDSAIGGKTAVNIEAMKNLVGTFYPPRLVLADPAVLSSLNDRTFRSGFYEVVKHAILGDPALFRELEGKIESLRPNQTKILGPLLARAARVKVQVVSRDEREAGLRRVLNLGHTFGHALEEVTHYRRFLHGEAVGWGMLAATRLAEIVGLLDPVVGKRVARLVLKVGPMPPIRGLEAERIVKLLPRDKKAIGGQIHWVLPERIGQVKITKDVPLAAASRAFRDVQRGYWHD
jgi:3-dehydroquinate synthase